MFLTKKCGVNPMNIKQILYAIAIIANITTISSYAASPHYKHLQETYGVNANISQECEKHPAWAFGFMSNEAHACSLLEKFVKANAKQASSIDNTHNPDDINVWDRHVDGKWINTQSAIRTIFADRDNRNIWNEIRNFDNGTPLCKKRIELRKKLLMTNQLHN